MADIAVVILTYNEGLHLNRAIESVLPFAKTVHVIDSYSTDDTVKAANWHGAEVLQHEFKNQADQFEWAISNISTDAQWILRLDADEIIEPDLAQKIEHDLASLPPGVTGITFDRKHIFLGRWIKWGGRYPLRLLRAFRRNFGGTEQRWMDEHIFVTSGKVVHFNGGFADHNLNDIGYFTAKHNKYATREAVEILDQRLNFLGRIEHAGSTSKQAAAKKWIKRKIYNRVPFPISALGYFIYRYFFQFGFLDGKEGTAYHFLQGFWYRFLAGAKAMELERSVSHLSDKQQIKEELTKLTGLKL